jgi:formate dehydrogenase maturation protein FdhE
MATKKITKVEMFALIAQEVADKPEMVEFINHEIELLTKKATSKRPTKVQIENESFKAEILAYLTEVGKAVTIKEMQAAVATLTELSNQKMTHLLSALVNEQKITKEYEKKTPYYSIA